MPTRSDRCGPAPATGRESEIDRALARAVVARFLAGAFGPVESMPADGKAREQRLAAVAAAAVELDDREGGPLARVGRDLAACRSPLPGVRQRLFGHTLRGAVCPYETEYGRRELIQQAHELADLAGFYEAFGLKVSQRQRERPDHIACELEFLAVLSLKEAHALERLDGEMLEVTRMAIAKFLTDHLGRFGRAFAVSLQSEDRGYYGRAGELLGAFVELECRRYGVEPGPTVLELRSTREDEVPMACGTGDGLVQIGSPVDIEE